MDIRRSVMILAVFVTALLVIPSGCSFASAVEGPKLVKLTYYLHDDFVPPDTTGVQIASANGTFTNAGIFGDTTAFDSILRTGIEKESPVIGSGSGLVVALKALNFITFVHDFRISNYAGTLSASARINVSAPSWEVGISTGTGSFRGAGGYFTVSIADPNPLGLIIKYEATVFLPRW